MPQAARRFANAPLYWICLAVMAVAIIDLAWRHWFRFADNMEANPDMALFLKTHPSTADRLAALEAKVPAWFDTLAKPNPALVRYNQTFRPASASK